MSARTEDDCRSDIVARVRGFWRDPEQQNAFFEFRVFYPFASSYLYIYGERYSEVMGVLSCRFAFAMARSALVCLRGSRSHFQGLNDSSLELPARVVNTESRL